MTQDEGHAEGLDLVITRDLDASPERAFRLWADPDHVSAWNAPEGFAVVDGAMDVRPGGAWRTTLRGPDGVSMRLGGTYRAVEPGRRLAFSHAWRDAQDAPGPETEILVTFEPLDTGARCRLTLRQTGFANPMVRDGHRGGWSQSLDALATYARGIRA